MKCPHCGFEDEGKSCSNGYILGFDETEEKIMAVEQKIIILSSSECFPILFTFLVVVFLSILNPCRT